MLFIVKASMPSLSIFPIKLAFFIVRIPPAPETLIETFPETVLPSPIITVPPVLSMLPLMVTPSSRISVPPLTSMLPSIVAPLVITTVSLVSTTTPPLTSDSITVLPQVEAEGSGLQGSLSSGSRLGLHASFAQYWSPSSSTHAPAKAV